mmetsp:Transcript_35543/g.66215  ORF Transcript_35543/g.66215 Transcript_35543/m.66215 type:complete len:216 (-) Transcript_35543:666-1313(-)
MSRVMVEVKSPLVGCFIQEQLLLSQLLENRRVSLRHFTVLLILVLIKLQLLHLPEHLLELREMLDCSAVRLLLVNQQGHAFCQVLQGTVPNSHAHLLVFRVRRRLQPALAQSTEGLIHATVIHKQRSELRGIHLPHAGRRELLRVDKAVSVAGLDARNRFPEVCQAGQLLVWQALHHLPPAELPAVNSGACLGVLEFSAVNTSGAHDVWFQLHVH